MAIGAILSGAASCSSAQKYTSVSARTFGQEIKAPDAQILDVRDSTEYADGHIAGATNINIASGNFLNDAQKVLDKKKPVYVYCRSGRRSRDAADRLSREGYKAVNLNGGIIEWKSEGLPVVEGQN